MPLKTESFEDAFQIFRNGFLGFRDWIRFLKTIMQTHVSV